MIEQDSKGFYIGSVPELPGCYTQAKSIDKRRKRMREAIEIHLEVKKPIVPQTEFLGVLWMRI